MLNRLIDWWLARRGEKRVSEDTPIIIIRKVPVEVEVIREVEKIVEVPVEVYKHFVPKDLVTAAGALCLQIADAPQAGEWKRHQVYSRLLKLCPEESKRDVALAIEYALREANVK